MIITTLDNLKQEQTLKDTHFITRWEEGKLQGHSIQIFSSKIIVILDIGQLFKIKVMRVMKNQKDCKQVFRSKAQQKQDCIHEGESAYCAVCVRVCVCVCVTSNFSQIQFTFALCCIHRVSVQVMATKSPHDARPVLADIEFRFSY